MEQRHYILSLSAHAAERQSPSAEGYSSLSAFADICCTVATMAKSKK
jgi:hypothetical protein